MSNRLRKVKSLKKRFNATGIGVASWITFGNSSGIIAFALIDFVTPLSARACL